METAVLSEHFGGVYFSEKPHIKHTYENYLTKKKVESRGAKTANFVLKTTGYIGSNSNLKKSEEKQRREWLIKQRLENSVVENFEIIGKSPVLHLARNQDIRGPYTIRADFPARTQRMFYNGKEVFFGLTTTNKFVVYSILENEKGKQMKVHYLENISASNNNTAYLKNKAKQTLLNLLGYNLHNIQSELAEIRKAA